MQLLDTLTLPSAQFTCLSILLQLHHEDFSSSTASTANSAKVNNHYASSTPKPTLHQCHSLTSDKPKIVPVYSAQSKVYYIASSRQSIGHDMDETTLEVAPTPIIKEAIVLTVHYDDLLEPYYTILVDGQEKQTDNSHLSLNPDGVPFTVEGKVGGNDDTTAPRRRSLSHSVIRKDLTIISPLCIIPESSAYSALDSLQKKIMVERGMRDDFIGIDGRGGGGEEETDLSTTKSESKTVAKLPSNSNAQDKGEESTSGGNKTIRKGVSFHQDTKAGKEAIVPRTTPGSMDEKKANDTFTAAGDLPLKLYKPPSSHTRCPLGFHLYYVQLNIEDVKENNEKATTFQRVMSVLLPNISLDSLKPIGKEMQSGVILLTVAMTGPAYDLYGCSALMMNLPNRLQEAMTMLAAVDTTPRKEDIILPLLKEDESKLKKGKPNRKIAFNKSEEEQAAQQTKTMVYDSAYFQRLYMGLLATVMDDDDGLLRDHDTLSLLNNTPSVPQSIAPSSRMKDVSKSKNKLFTFSRRVGKADKYESGDAIDGGIIPLEIEVDSNKSESGSSSHAEIVRRAALQMEILSLAEDDMSLPKYQHAGESERRRNQVKSPKAGGGIAAIASSGRFGRKETQFDLAGFEYKPSSSSGSVSGTASTMASSDDVSTTTGGDETATLSSKYTMLSNTPSVPTLSKSKKDSGGRSSRFKFLQKRKESKTGKSPSKPPLPPQSRQIPQQQVFDPFSYDVDVIDKGQEYKTEANEADSVASGSTKETPEPVGGPAVDAVTHSFSEDESDAKSLPVSAPPTPIPTTEEEDEVDMAEPEYEEEVAVPLGYLDVDLALNEDLTCEYKKSKLSSITVDGTVQVRIKNQEEPSPDDEQQSPIPFFLVFQDHSRHIKTVQENKKFVEHVDARSTAREYTYSITVPRENEYFPVVRYKCSNFLRPVPIRVQSRVRTQGKSCRVALQISSNPQNPSSLVHLTIIMGVPKGIVKGHTLQCNPPGGTFNEQKSVVLWCVSELGGGEKFQLQAMFDLEDEYLDAENDADATAELASKLEFPVLARCQCSGAQLSDISLGVADIADHYPAEINMNIVRRFRVSHKEK
ncbi:hypothetical protein ACHAWO_008705 [Cyclotella atomus]|uniref:MHD domain-containing protein n=1 Tax=Cyclotella atomus TaxID=382360 RepID=A0ABD3NAS5_9STRA